MKMTMGAKVISLFIIGGLVPFITIGLISYNTASTSLIKQAMNQLTSIREMKKAALEKYLADRTSDIKALASNTTTLSAVKGLKLYFKDIDREEARKLYILDNPCPVGQKYNLMDAMDGSTYSMLHARYHTIFKNYLEEYGYFYDLFLVDAETGDLVYSVCKEDDYGTNLYNGKYKDTNIGEVARAVNISTDNTVKHVDFRPYAPSNGDPARFMACPVIDEDGERVGILILQFSVEAIDEIMTARAGLGESGETYLVGPEKLMRSNSRFSEESTILKITVDTPAIKAAQDGKTGATIIKDYRGVPVLSAYAPLKVGEWTWAIVAEIDEAEALAPAIALRNRMLIIGVLITLGVAGLAFLVLRITGHVTNLLRNLVHELSEGSSQIASASRQISASSQGLSEGTTEQASSVEETSASMEEMAAMTRQNAQNAGEATQLATQCDNSAQEGNQSMLEMNAAMKEIDQSSKKINEIIKTIDDIASQTDLLALNAGAEAEKAAKNGNGFAVVAGEVRNLAQRSTDAAKDTSTLIQEIMGKTNTGAKLAKNCTGSFQNIASNIKHVISLADQLSHTQSQGTDAAQKISQALQDCVADTREALSASEQLASRMNEVNKNSRMIGESIKTIDGIAFQTNLLALNAAVEAARADEHGRGFAGVAEEVRSLAQKSAVAAKDTTGLIQESLQKINTGTGLTKKCTESFQEIVTNVKKMNVLVDEISTASQEQSQGVEQVSKAIQQIDQSLQHSAASAEESASTSEELSAQSQVLNNLVTKIANEVGSGNGKVEKVEDQSGKTPPAPARTEEPQIEPSQDAARFESYDRLNQELFYNEINYTPTKEESDDGNGNGGNGENKRNRMQDQPAPSRTSETTFSSVE